MSASVEDGVSTASQSRRFACDRCHRHKLRCERTPVIANGNIIDLLGTCKRCTKAQVPCETNNRKASAGNDASGTTNDSAIGASPFDCSVFGNDANSVLDFDAFDFDLGAPSGEDLAVVAAGGCGSTRPRAPDARDDCMQRLLELHAVLFKDLHHITDADLAEALSSPASTSIPPRDANVSDLNLVHRILFASERLIELLPSLRQASTPPPSHNDLKRRYMLLSDEETTPSTPKRFHTSDAIPRPHTSPSVSTEGPTVFGNDGTSSSSTTPSIISPIELPLTALCFTCHIGLLSVYRTTFTQIHDVLRAATVSPGRSAGRRDSAMAGTGGRKSGQAERLLAHLGGQAGMLSSQLVLGIRIHMEMMTHSLERIEDAWAGVLDEHGEGRDCDGNEEEEACSTGVGLGGTATLALLRSMLLHEGFEGLDHGDRIGLGSVIRVLKSIRRLLRNSNGA